MGILVSAIEIALTEERKQSDNAFRISALGKCGRALAYKYHGVPGRPIDWKGLGTLDDGNLAHDQLRPLIRRGLLSSHSCYRLVDVERDVSLNSIPGHIDGYLKHRNGSCKDSGHDDMLLEVKSMNDLRFQSFKEGGQLDFEYRAQVSGYLRALGLYKALVLGKNKNKFDLHEMLYHLEDSLVNSRLDVIAKVKISEQPEQVDKEHQPNDKGYLPWQCGYCPYTELCWRHEGVREVKSHIYKIEVPKIVSGK